MRFRIATLALLALSILPPASPSALAQGAQLGTAQNAVGRVTVVSPDGIENQLAGRGELALFEHDTVATEANSRALLDIGGGHQVTLEANTTCKMLYRWEKARGLTTIIRLQKGELSAKAQRAGTALEIETPVGVVAGPRNAELTVRVNSGGQSLVKVVRGAVDVATPLGSCRVQAPAVSALARGKTCAASAAADPKPDAATSAAVDAKPDARAAVDAKPDARAAVELPGEPPPNSVEDFVQSNEAE